ncbi:MAG: hypothetical protein ACRDRR_03895 [Pseudonocardiaceae bacterium]
MGNPPANCPTAPIIRLPQLRRLALGAAQRGVAAGSVGEKSEMYGFSWRDQTLSLPLTFEAVYGSAQVVHVEESQS